MHAPATATRSNNVETNEKEEMGKRDGKRAAGLTAKVFFFAGHRPRLDVLAVLAVAVGLTK